MKCFTLNSAVVLFFLVLLIGNSLAQTDWTTYPGNPVLPWGDRDSWEFVKEWSFVVHDGEQYIMYYGGGPRINALLTAMEIGMATSEDGMIWTKYEENPVMSFSLTAAWDDSIVDPGPVIYDGEQYRMWYSGMSVDSIWSIGLATSTDGIEWVKYEGNPLLELGDEGRWDDKSVRVASVIYDQSQYKMWYTGSDSIYSEDLEFPQLAHWRVGYATSPDGISWTKYEENPVLDIGEPGTWEDKRIDHCYVLFNGDSYEMWYQGGNEPYLYYTPTGYATSPDGITWTKYENNPVYNSGVSSVLLEGEVYRLWTWVLGYAEDYSHIAHSDSLALSCLYAKPAVDTLKVSAWVENPKEQSLTVMAMIAGEDSVVIDSTELSDQGEGFWQGWMIPEGEQICQVWVETRDETSGTVHNGWWWNVDRFCTSGPVNVSHLEVISQDTIAVPGKTLQYRIYMQNNGQTATVEDISIHVTGLDTFTNVIAFEDPRYGDIPPGEIANPHRAIRIQFLEDCPTNIYTHYLVEVKTGDQVFWSDTFSVFVEEPSGISEDDQKLPLTYNLGQNYPNPFNPKTIINYELPITNTVELSIYNLTGQKVATLVQVTQRAGFHQVEWDASGFASGVYYYHLEAGEFREVKKMVLLR